MRILPRPLGQVLTETINTLARTWKAVVPTAILVFIPASLLSAWVYSRTGVVDLLGSIVEDPGYLQSLPPEEVDALMRPVLTALVVTAAVQGLASLYVFLTASRVTRQRMVEEEADGREARRHAVSRLGVGLAAGVIAVIAAAGAFIVGTFAWGLFAGDTFISFIMLGVLLTPAVWLAVSLSMLVPVTSFEARGVRDTLARSATLVRGRWGATVGFLLLVGLLGIVAAQLIQFIAIPLSVIGGAGLGVIIVALVGVAAQGMLMAAIGTACAHWYIDLRARAEPLMAEDL